MTKGLELRADEVRAWRLLIEAKREAGGVALGEFDWPQALSRALDALQAANDRADHAEAERREERSNAEHWEGEYDDAVARLAAAQAQEASS